MSTNQNRIKKLLLFCLLLLPVIAACSGGKPKPFADPNAGVWEGKNGSFMLRESGEIADFYWLLNADHPIQQSRCPIGWNENIPVEAGTGEIILLNNNGDVSFRITIVFTAADTATLTYEYDFCPSTFSIGFDEDGKTKIFSGEATVNFIAP